MGVGMKNPMVVLMLANTRAGQLRAEAAGEPPIPQSVFKGAASHSGAFLLQALDEMGWHLAPKLDDFDRAHGALDELHDAFREDDGSDADHARILDAMERARVVLDDLAPAPPKPWADVAAIDEKGER